MADAAIARIPGAAPSVNRFRERLSQYINDDAQQHQKVTGSCGTQSDKFAAKAH